MRKWIISLTATMLVASCASSTQDQSKTTSEFLDLSGEDQHELVERYWTKDKLVEPNYPVSAARQGISGCVTLKVGIGSDGSAQGYLVQSSYPQGVFDDYAAAAVSQWQWNATPENSEHTPVLARITLTFNMSLDDLSEEYIANCGKPETAA